MPQTGLIENAHNDLVTDAAYDFYGLRLATCSLDQRCVACSTLRDACRMLNGRWQDKGVDARREAGDVER